MGVVYDATPPTVAGLQGANLTATNYSKLQQEQEKHQKLMQAADVDIQAAQFALDQGKQEAQLKAAYNAAELNAQIASLHDAADSYKQTGAPAPGAVGPSQGGGLPQWVQEELAEAEKLLPALSPEVRAIYGPYKQQQLHQEFLDRKRNALKEEIGDQMAMGAYGEDEGVLIQVGKLVDMLEDPNTDPMQVAQMDADLRTSLAINAGRSRYRADQLTWSDATISASNPSEIGLASAREVQALYEAGLIPEEQFRQRLIDAAYDLGPREITLPTSGKKVLDYSGFSNGHGLYLEDMPANMRAELRLHAVDEAREEIDAAIKAGVVDVEDLGGYLKMIDELVDGTQMQRGASGATLVPEREGKFNQLARVFGWNPETEPLAPAPAAAPDQPSAAPGGAQPWTPVDPTQLQSLIQTVDSSRQTARTDEKREQQARRPWGLSGGFYGFGSTTSGGTQQVAGAETPADPAPPSVQEPEQAEQSLPVEQRIQKLTELMLKYAEMSEGAERDAIKAEFLELRDTLSGPQIQQAIDALNSGDKIPGAKNTPTPPGGK